MMFLTIGAKKAGLFILCGAIVLGMGLMVCVKAFSSDTQSCTQPDDAENFPELAQETSAPSEDKKDFIKWVDFDISYEAMTETMKLDIDSQGNTPQYHWIELLAYLGVKYGGDFSKYKTKDLKQLTELLKDGNTMEELTKDMKYYSYYKEAYTAVLGEYVGIYQIEKEDEDQPEGKVWEEHYGLKVFSPIARGYEFNHYEDFGNKRSYGYARKHLGHDLMGSVGTPVVAIESGTVEVMGWNQYGGWRIGIRSFDKKRYYYYAHLRKNHPYNDMLEEGGVVKAGDVIGYLGRTGYSTTENTNNIETPHLHMGIQLIFDESQKEGPGEIWIDAYDIVKLLQKNRSTVYKEEEKKEYYRKFDFNEPLLQKQ